MSRLSLLLLGFAVVGVGRAEAPAISATDRAADPLVMEEISVDAGYTPRQSFGFTMNVRKDNTTKLVHSIHVIEVQRGSEAERKGLGPRVRIDRINGKRVEEFVASFLAGTELNQIFVNRHEGERVVLEISIPGRSEPKVITLVQHLVDPNRGSTLPRY